MLKGHARRSGKSTTLLVRPLRNELNSSCYSLIEDLLDASRAQLGKMKFHFEPVHIVSLIKDVVERCLENLTNSGCTVKLDLGDEILIICDRLRIEQVVLNLLSNSSNYAPNLEIVINVWRVSDGVKISVRDQGIGIDPKYHSSIFERFERGAADKNFSGLGLGLYISKQIINEHGGAIEVKSELGKGSEFIVFLPCKKTRKLLHLFESSLKFSFSDIQAWPEFRHKTLLHSHLPLYQYFY